MTPVKSGGPERRWRSSPTRRAALRGVAAFLSGSSLLPAQQDPFRDHSRIPGLNELLTAFDFEPVAHARLPRDAYDYTALGVEGEFTLRRNRQAFEWVELAPKAMVNAATVQTATEICGTKMAFPILVAPSAGQGLLHPEGEMAMHQGASAASATMIVSINASVPIEKTAAAAPGPFWYQHYPRGQDPEENRELLERAQAAGCRAIVLTADNQIGTGVRERTMHDRNLSLRAAASGRRPGARAAPPTNPYRVTGGYPYADWAWLDKIRPFIKVPLLVKAILTAEDARLCVERGLNGVIVSNHGGRNADYHPSTLEALPEIVDAVQGRIPVLVDSGFRRGADVLKALALGASGVCLGRVPRWGLAAYGPPGVQRILEIVQNELVLAMAHTGRPTLASIDRTLVRTDFP
jgi:4-hydroxymandelate oxidase